MLILVWVKNHCFGQKNSHIPLIKSVNHFRQKTLTKIKFRYNEKRQVTSITSNDYILSKRGQWKVLKKNRLQRVYRYFRDSIQVFDNKQLNHVIQLDSQKLAHQHRFYRKQANSIWIQQTTFNIQKYPVSIIEYNPNDSAKHTRESFYEFKGSNITHTRSIFYETIDSIPHPVALYHSSSYYLYYPNTRNTLGNKNLGQSFLGRSNKNLIKYAGHGTKGVHYLYKFDSKGRVSEQIGERRSNSIRLVYTYYD